MTQNLLQRLPPGARIAVIRLRSLGDCVLTTPAISLLKAHRPDLEVRVVVEDRFAAVYSANPDVEAVLPPTTAAIARFRPDLALNLHGGSTSSQLTFASRARWRAGFEHFRFRALYNVRIPTAQKILGIDRKVHTAEHIASAIFFLGVPNQPVPQARLFAPELLKEDGPRNPKPYAVIHPKASQADKTWPAENFLASARHLRNHLGLTPVFIAGPGESLDEFAEFPCQLASSLEDLKTLLRHATLFLGNDSGPAHMAAAFSLPVTVLFGSSDPVIWAPWQTESHVLTHPDGIAAIPIQAVLEALPVLAR